MLGPLFLNIDTSINPMCAFLLWIPYASYLSLNHLIRLFKYFTDELGYIYFFTFQNVTDFDNALQFLFYDMIVHG